MSNGGACATEPAGTGPTALWGTAVCRLLDWRSCHVTVRDTMPAASAAPADLPASDRWVIFPSGPLSGDVTIAGAKNAALKHLAAALLTPGETVLERVPDIEDITAMRHLLASVGVTTRRQDDGMHVLVPEQIGWEPDPTIAGQLRASVLLAAPLLARTGQVRLPYPGGCKLGETRAIDLHLAALRALGAQVSTEPDAVVAHTRRLRGTTIDLPRPSVGATEQAMLTAAAAAGRTVIHGAAKEPEIADLAGLLTHMGAPVDGAGTSTIHVTPRGTLRPVRWRTVADRIEAGTFAAAALVTGGRVFLDGIDLAPMAGTVRLLRHMGAAILPYDGGVVVDGAAPLAGAVIPATPYPGLPTDLQPMMTAVALGASGTSEIIDTVFPDRLGVAEQLALAGAPIELGFQRAWVHGPVETPPGRYRGADLRAAAALAVAGLGSSGAVEIDGMRHAHRGYDNFAGRLAALGAQIATDPERELLWATDIAPAAEI